MKTPSSILARLALLLGATTLLISTWAQSQATLTPIGKWPEYPLPLVRGGWGLPVEVAGSYAYLAGYGQPLPESASEKAILQLLTLDVSKPSQPRYLSHVDTLTDLTSYRNYLAARMRIFSSYAYVTLVGGNDPHSVLAVFSLSEPALPRLVGTLALSACAKGIEVADGHAYVSANSTEFPRGRLLVIDVSDPAHPTLKTTAFFETYGQCISVAGNYAYVGGLQTSVGGRVEIIDISNPSQALVVGGFDLTGCSGGVMAIAAEGSLLHCCTRFQDNYDVFDRTDPLNPIPLGRWELMREGCVTSIRVIGSTVILGGFVGSSSQWFSMSILDVVDPQNPQLRGQVDTFSVDVGGLDVTNHVAYLRDGDQLRVLDIKDAAAPVQLGQIDTGFWQPLISTDGDLACLLDGPRLRVLNVSNPRTPTLVGAKDLACAGPFKVVGSYGYVAAGSFLQILDLRNPSQPVEAGRFSVQATGLDVVGNRANVTGGNRFTVIDVANVAAPVELGYLSFTNPPGLPQVVGDYAYCRLDTSDLVIVDIRDPSAMVEIGRYHPTNGIESFQVVGQYAYVLLWDEKTLHVVDLADPANPKRVGRYVWEGETLWPEELLVQGRFAFVALSGDTNRVDILEVGDPTHPVKFGEHYSDGIIAGFAMVGNTLYTTSGAGLTVLDFFAPNTSPRLRLNLPVLSSGVAVLTWEGGPGISLQKTTSLSTPNWQDVPGTLGQSLAILPQADAAFFRLMRP